jgi:hypothetical protein
VANIGGHSPLKDFFEFAGGIRKDRIYRGFE